MWARSRLAGRWRRSASPTPAASAAWARSSGRSCSTPSDQPADRRCSSPSPASPGPAPRRWRAPWPHARNRPPRRRHRVPGDGRRAGPTLAEFGAVAEADPAIDLELDSGWPPAPGRATSCSSRGWPGGSPPTRGWPPSGCGSTATTVERAAGWPGAGRRAGRSRPPPPNREREASEAARYRAYYGIDLDDRSIYDLVLDARPAGRAGGRDRSPPVRTAIPRSGAVQRLA